MGRIEIEVKKDTCLGYQVFRGSIKAKELAPAMWIDFHDEELNPYGYQRPFDTKRSKKAAEYATKDEKAFWPESILAIRDNSEVDEDSDKVYWHFAPDSPSNDDFGTLIVEYNENRVEHIGGQEVNWRRAFSQVDCQHRLGQMMESDRYVTVCIIPSMKRLEESRIFKIINDTQKKISTSLVDAIVLISTASPLDMPEIHWAYNLGIDPGSSFFKRVSTEGRNITSQEYLVTLRTLRTCISSLVTGRRYIRTHISSQPEYDQVYVFIRSFWNAICGLWPVVFSDNRNFKLMTVPGLKGLSRYGRGFFLRAMDDGDTSQKRIEGFFAAGPSLIDWSVSGPFRDATGNAGARTVFEELVRQYGKP